MNEALTLVPLNVDAVGLDDLLAVLALPSQRHSAGELSAPIAETIKGIGSFVDGLLLRAIAAHSGTEFVRLREELFLPYAQTVTSLAKLVKLVVPSKAINRALDESFCELEAEFREQGLARFGEAARDQAVFTVWTFRRTSGLISRLVASGPLPPSLRRQDKDLASNFAFFATWAQFHLDCLLAAIRNDRPVHLPVLPEIVDGLRAAVNAYGYARQGLDLRVPREESLIACHEWDDEDQQLLDASMKDMATEPLDD